MELAIPLIALGSMYVVSNQKTSRKENTNNESFVNMGKTGPSQLPGVDERLQNFPTTNAAELDNLPHRFTTDMESTNNYLNQTEYFKKEKDGVFVGNEIQETYNFPTPPSQNQPVIHGTKDNRTYNMHSASSVLDTYNGSGSQYQRKTEQAPLFKPQSDMQWAHGTPNVSNFIQSRVNPSMKNNMVRPFETVKVGGGVGQGATEDGCGGFNSGLNNRDRIMPKTVDELRNSTKPKCEYMMLNHEGPANAPVKNIGIQGDGIKQNPDTHYVNSKDRWLVTTGQEISGPLHGAHIVRESGREDYSAPIIGSAHTSQAHAASAPETFTNARRTATDASSFAPPSYAGGQGPMSNAAHDSITKYSNNRQMDNNQPMTLGAMFSSAIGAVVAPLIDVVKPCRKEEHIVNARVYGNMGTSAIGGGYTQAPNAPKLTVKETTMYSSNGFIGNQGDGGYEVANNQVGSTQRDTTGTTEYMGGIGGMATQRGNMTYDAIYNHSIDNKKEDSVKSRGPSGNTQVFNPQQNVFVSKNGAHNISNQVDRPSAPVAGGPSAHIYGQEREVKEYDQSFQNERINPKLISALKSNPYTHIYSDH